MNREEIYSIWRSAEAPWSRWAKPVLFSFLGRSELEARSVSGRAWEIPFQKETAMVVDLPGAVGVLVGRALAQAGFRPVPVYNACPFAASCLDEVQETDPPPVVDVLPIMRALGGVAETLRNFVLDPSAPPAFLLDANRRGMGIRPAPEWFDNRSFVSDTDFPSAAFFASQDIRRLILIQAGEEMQPDLRMILLGLQEAGMAIERQAPWATWNPSSLRVRRPTLLRRVWDRLRQRFGYRRNEDGLFGDPVRRVAG